jgi:hypothetical protein
VKVAEPVANPVANPVAKTAAVDKKVAKAEPSKSEPSQPEPVKAAAPQASSEPSVVARLLSFSPKLPSLFGSDDSPKAIETAAPVPLPPQRPRASAQPLKPLKPEASLVTAPPVKMAMNAPAHRVTGSAPVLSGDLAR